MIFKNETVITALTTISRSITSKHKLSKKKSLGTLELPSETTSKKKKKKKTEEEDTSNNSENVCDISDTLKGSEGASANLEGTGLVDLGSNNLKLFTKTSSGRYKEVDKSTLLKWLQQNSIEEPKKSQDTEKNAKTVAKQTTSKTSAIQISSKVIQSMTLFSMLNTGDAASEDKNRIESSAAYPSVSTILNETMPYESRLVLEKWKKNMVAELGEEGFLQFTTDPGVSCGCFRCWKIFVEMRRKRKQIVVDQMARGSKFHSCLRQFLEKSDEREVKLDPEIEGCWKSVEKVLPMISNVRILEGKIFHPQLFYKGRVDCVASYQDVPCVIEWKKSDKPKPYISSTYEAPVQVCAYLGALPYSFPSDRCVDNGLVVVAYTSGAPASVFQLDREQCLKYWAAWRQRVQTFWVKKSCFK